MQTGASRPDVLESLTPNVRKRVEALQALQVQFLYLSLAFCEIVVPLTFVLMS